AVIQTTGAIAAWDRRKGSGQTVAELFGRWYSRTWAWACGFSSSSERWTATLCGQRPEEDNRGMDAIGGHVHSDGSSRRAERRFQNDSPRGGSRLRRSSER